MRTTHGVTNSNEIPRRARTSDDESCTNSAYRQASSTNVTPIELRDGRAPSIAGAVGSRRRGFFPTPDLALG
jgi:hypothetical protein